MKGNFEFQGLEDFKCDELDKKIRELFFSKIDEVPFESTQLEPEISTKPLDFIVTIDKDTDSHEPSYVVKPKIGVVDYTGGFNNSINVLYAGRDKIAFEYPQEFYVTLYYESR